MFFYSPLEQFMVFLIYQFSNLGEFLTFFITNLIFYNLLALLILSFFVYTSIKNLKFKFSWNDYFIGIFTSFFYTTYLAELSKKKQNFFTFFFIIFCFLIVSNILGMLSFGFTTTSHISITFTLAGIIFLGINFLGFFLHKLKFLSIFAPEGAPESILPFIILVEIISYVSRIFSLSIRLFANMMSGHTLLFIIGTFCVFMFYFYGFIFIVPFLFIIFILLILEFFIALLQAYVFSILSVIYLKDGFNGGH